jgi:hypothetical protein
MRVPMRAFRLFYFLRHCLLKLTVRARACVLVCLFGLLQVQSVEYRGVNEAGPVTTLLARKMFGLLAGTEPDPHGWVHVVMRGA